MSSLKERLEHEIVENKKRGTVDYFCDLLKTDDYNGMLFSLAQLENEGKVELVGTKTSYAGNGLPVIQGLYAISPETLADNTVNEIRKFEKEYVKSHGDSWEKLGFDPVKMEESLKTVREMIVVEVRKARQRN